MYVCVRVCVRLCVCACVCVGGCVYVCKQVFVMHKFIGLKNNIICQLLAGLIFLTRLIQVFTYIFQSVTSSCGTKLRRV